MNTELYYFLKKAFITITLLFCGGNLLQAQSLEWAKGIGGGVSNDAAGLSIAVSHDGGYIYISGVTSQPGVDFDPGAGTATIPDGGAFILKMTAAGAFVWVKQVAISSGAVMALDSADNIYITGNIDANNVATNDFDPGPGTFYLNLPNGGGYISKFDANGNFIWAKGIANTMNIPYGIQMGAIALDAAANIHITGVLADTVDFDPGPGVTTLATAGVADIFVLKLDAAGNFIWAKDMGGYDYDQCYAITVDRWGSVYTTGTFYSIADFDPGPGVANFAPMTTGAYPEAIFLSKLDVNGNYVWAKTFGGEEGEGLVTDSSGNIYILGAFPFDGLFDPTGSNASSKLFVNNTYGSVPGTRDVFISKLDSGGKYIWAKNIASGKSNDWGGSIALDAAQKHIYAMGSFEGGWARGGKLWANFGNDSMYGNSNITNFITKYSIDGDYSWVAVIGGNGLERGHLAIDASNDVYSTGTYFNDGTSVPVVDFDPGTKTTDLFFLPDSGSMFVHKMFCSDTTSSVLFDTTCSPNYVLNGHIFNNSGMYLQKIPNSEGCDSNITLYLTINSLIQPAITVNGYILGTASKYDHYQWYLDNVLISGATDSTITVTKNGLYKIAVTNNTGCSDTSINYHVTNLSIAGISEAMDQIKIYPNPASGVVYIQSPIKTDAILTAMDGRVIREMKNKQKFSIGDLTNGIYLLRITDEKGTLLKVEKLIKQN